MVAKRKRGEGENFDGNSRFLPPGCALGRERSGMEGQ